MLSDVPDRYLLTGIPDVVFKSVIGNCGRSQFRLMSWTKRNLVQLIYCKEVTEEHH